MPENEAIYKDPAKSAEQRTEDLLKKMTIDEKCSQLGSYWIFEILDNFKFSLKKTDKTLKNGIGQVTRIGGASSFHPHEAAETANRIQKYLKENTRLGIPAIMHEEICSGLMARDATLFPQAIGIASSWDTGITERMMNIIRDQLRAIGGHQGFAPVLDITRDPRWGRLEETFGEDPYLAASMGCAYIKGFQEDNGRLRAVATGKHFAGYGNSEGGLNWSPCQIPERQLNEVFLYTFEAAVKEAGLLSIMNSYSEIDGLPCCASKELFRNILKEAWGFRGIVVSDYWAIKMLNEYHHTAESNSEAAVQAMSAGIDIELPTVDCYGDELMKALENGKVSMENVNDAVRRILLLKFKLGIFENPYVESSKAELVFDTEKQRKLSYELAAESMVLLKNDGILPLSKDIKTIAVIGPNADNWRNIIGDYAYPCHIEALIEMKQTNPFNMTIPENIGDISGALDVKTVLQGIKSRLSEKTEVLYVKGCAINDNSKEGFGEAEAAAEKSDAVIVVAGDKSGPLESCTTGEARDVSSLALPGVQEELICKIISTGKPVILILVSGRPYMLNKIHEKVNAVIEAWLPGEEGGAAAADILFGNKNPGGKLPVSFPRSAGQIPVYYSHKPSGGRSHWMGDYVNESTKPLYPFGYGLSYTSFKYTNINTEKNETGLDDSIKIEFDVKNTGRVEGDEVVQLYIHYRPSDCLVTRPLKELKGFKRIHIEAGETKHVIFTLFTHQLAFYDEDMSFVIKPGEVEIMAGSSSEDIHLTCSFRIIGKEREIVKKKVFFSEVKIS